MTYAVTNIFLGEGAPIAPPPTGFRASPACAAPAVPNADAPVPLCCAFAISASQHSILTARACAAPRWQPSAGMRAQRLLSSLWHTARGPSIPRKLRWRSSGRPPLILVSSLPGPRARPRHSPRNRQALPGAAPQTYGRLETALMYRRAEAERATLSTARSGAIVARMRRHAHCLLPAALLSCVPVSRSGVLHQCPVGRHHGERLRDYVLQLSRCNQYTCQVDLARH